MPNPTRCQELLTEKEILQDCLSSQKHAAATYNAFAGECVNEQLRTTMLSILDEEHKMQADIFSCMQSNGWYQVEQADRQKVQQAKQKFSGS